MRFDLRGVSPFQIAVAAVLGAFAFLANAILVSDRLGGWPVGYVSSTVIALLVFFSALATARRLAEKPTELKPRESPSPPSQTTIVQTPVHVEVPVSVRVERERDATTREMPIPAKEETSSLVSPPPIPTPSPIETFDELFDVLPTEETIFNRSVEVNVGRGGAWSHELPLQVGDTLEGNLREKDLTTFSWMILNEKNLADFLNGEDEWTIAAGEEDVKATPIRWRCTKKGRCYLVLYAIGKWYSREVRVILRRIRVP